MGPLKHQIGHFLLSTLWVSFAAVESKVLLVA
jgi:hypothetical protein